MSTLAFALALLSVVVLGLWMRGVDRHIKALNARIAALEAQAIIRQPYPRPLTVKPYEWTWRSIEDTITPRTHRL